MNPMRRALLFAALTITSTGIGTLLNWAQGIGLQLWQQMTWAVALFTGLLIGSAVERWPHRQSSPKRQ